MAYYITHCKSSSNIIQYSCSQKYGHAGVDIYCFCNGIFADLHLQQVISNFRLTERTKTISLYSNLCYASEGLISTVILVALFDNTLVLLAQYGSLDHAVTYSTQLIKVTKYIYIRFQWLIYMYILVFINPSQWTSSDIVTSTNDVLNSNERLYSALIATTMWGWIAWIIIFRERWVRCKYNGRLARWCL